MNRRKREKASRCAERRAAIALVFVHLNCSRRGENTTGVSSHCQIYGTRAYILAAVSSTISSGIKLTRFRVRVYMHWSQCMRRSVHIAICYVTSGRRRNFEAKRRDPR